MGGMIANRLSRVAGSSTLAIATRAKELKADGIDVIDFSVGEPDFPTPSNIKEAAKRAIDEDYTRYTPTTGMPALKAAIADSIEQHQGVRYEPKEIMVSSGAKNCLFNAAVALFNAGDEVLVPAPYWVSYPQQLNVLDAVTTVLPTTEASGFKITPDQMRAAVTGKTRALILNNPSNPTGSAYTRAELEALAEVVLEKDLLVVADEIYDRIVYDGFEFTSFAALGDEIKERTVLINGFSKTYAMTGWRLGYTCARPEIIAAMTKIQSHDTSNPCSVSQMAGIEALTGPQDDLIAMRERFVERRDLILEKLELLPGVSCTRPEGAFYVFPNVAGLIRTLGEQGFPVTDSASLAAYLLDKAHVAVVPGDGFGAEGYIRLSYAASRDTIEAGMERIAAAVGGRPVADAPAD